MKRALPLIALLLAACGGQSRPTQAPITGAPARSVDLPSWGGAAPGDDAVQLAQGRQQIGMAHWYGNQFNGRRTASGEVFNQNALTAAHRSLPFGTMVRVTNLATGQSVVVRVNDRHSGPPGVIIDLSREAARRIGALSETRVRMEIVSR